MYQRNRWLQTQLSNLRNRGHFWYLDACQVGINWLQDPKISEICQCPKRKSFFSISRQRSRPQWSGLFTWRKWSSFKPHITWRGSTKICTTANARAHTITLTSSASKRLSWKTTNVWHRAKRLLLAKHGMKMYHSVSTCHSCARNGTILKHKSHLCPFPASGT